MSFWNTIADKVNQLAYNVSQYTKNMYNLYFNPNPTTVTLQQYDENGNIVSTTVPNLAKIKHDMWDAVNAAVGLWYRTFYVDAENGNDNNPGTRQDAPFKTIDKALNSVPVGGRGVIYLKEGQIHEIQSVVWIVNKVIEIARWGSQTTYLTNKAYVDGDVVKTTGLWLRNSFIMDYFVNLRTANYPSGYSSLSMWEGFIRRFDHFKACITLYEITVEIGDTDFIRLASGPTCLLDLALYNTTIKQVGSNRAGLFIYNERGNISLSEAGTHITLQNGSTGSFKDIISGIQYDSNTGLPINVVSTVNLR